VNLVLRCTKRTEISIMYLTSDAEIWISLETTVDRDMYVVSSRGLTITSMVEVIHDMRSIVDQAT